MTKELRGINRRLSIEVTANLIDRLNAGVDKCGPDDCWNWIRCFRNSTVPPRDTLARGRNTP